jgi:hypothetical protein
VGRRVVSVRSRLDDGTGVAQDTDTAGLEERWAGDVASDTVRRLSTGVASQVRAECRRGDELRVTDESGTNAD